MSTANEIETEIHVDAAVVQQLIELESLFSRMLADVMEDLANCDLCKARFFLNDLFETNDFSECNTIGDILQRLRQGYINTFNIHSLQELLTCLNEKKLTKVVKAYEKKKERFLQKTTVLEFQRAVVSRVTPVLQNGRALVTMKVPKKLAWTRTLKDIEYLALEGFEESQKFFILLHAKPGSIIISWSFPEFLISKLEQLIRENATIFKKAGVEEVTVAGRIVLTIMEQEVHVHVNNTDYRVY